MATAIPSHVAPPESPRVWWGVVPAAALAAAAAAASVAFALAAGNPDGAPQVFLLEWVGVPVHRRRRDRLVVPAPERARAVDGRRRVGERLLRLAGGGLRGCLYRRRRVRHRAGRPLPARLPRVSGRAAAIEVRAHPRRRGLRGRGSGLPGGEDGAGLCVDPANLIELSRQAGVVSRVEDVQLLTLTATCLAGLVVLVRRRQGRPRRRSLGIVVTSFELALVMVALLFTIATFDWPGFQEVQRATLFVVGLSPIAFLFGLLDARLARSSIGDLYRRAAQGARASRPARRPGSGPGRPVAPRSRTGCRSSGARSSAGRQS